MAETVSFRHRRSDEIEGARGAVNPVRLAECDAGIHQSGEMQTLLRRELRAALEQIAQSAAPAAAAR